MKYGISNQNVQVQGDEIVAILNLAWDNGINTIDTAKAYGNSEKIIGNYLTQHLEKSWNIIAKLSDRDINITEQFQDSAEKLNVNPTVVLAHSAKLFLNEKFQSELQKIKDKYSISKIGVSLYNENEINQVMESAFKPDVIQLPLNILDSRLYQRGVLAQLVDQSIEIHARSAFLQGLFYLPDSEIRENFADVVPFIEKLKSIASAADLTLPELSLIWMVSLDEVSRVIIGVDSREHLKTHLATLNKKVNPAVFEKALLIRYENESILNPTQWPSAKIDTIIIANTKNKENDRLEQTAGEGSERGERQTAHRNSFTPPFTIKLLAIVQARMGSIRLPGKVLKEVNGKPLIEILLHRLSQSKKIDKIIIATTKNKENDRLEQIVVKLGFDVFRGNEDDVLDRYYQTARQYNPEAVVRITGDCPIIDPLLVDEVIGLYQENKVDYVSNTNPPSYPNGLDTEVFSFVALEAAHKQATKHHDREHVTPFIKTNSQFHRMTYTNERDLSGVRWTVDEKEDFEVIRNIINHFTPNLDFTWREVLELEKSHSEYFEANQGIRRNEGAMMGTGQKLWKRANRVIPGGNMLLSKRAEMFLPEKWPTYYDKAKGCSVWDLDGNKYIDMSIMGIGTNVLGYANDEVDNAVRKVIDKSNTSTFNCPEEVYLAEKLVELHPWSDKVRFARTGGEANAIAVRIARAASGRDKVAFCGYHGWHDWYLAANLSNSENLEGHLLSGLEPEGIPSGLEGSSLPFGYNNFDSIKNIVSNGDVGVIIMEVCRSMEPKDNFLQKIRQLATDNGIVLIFDEITSGFRSNLGGVHLRYGVEPDMAVFGKTMGNGYAVSAVIGKSEIMEYAQSSFISSTFWTERIGPVAALKTIEIMERDSVQEQITETGEYIKKCWTQLAEKYDLEVQIYGTPPIPHIGFISEQQLAIKTIITQEMLKNGYLAGNSVYVCIDHSKNIVDDYMDALDKPFDLISKIIGGEDPKTFLDGPICHGGFSRLN